MLQRRSLFLALHRFFCDARSFHPLDLLGCSSITLLALRPHLRRRAPLRCITIARDRQTMTFVSSAQSNQSKAAVVRRKGGPFQIETLTVDQPRADEVLVRIVATGVCHTDIVIRDRRFSCVPRITYCRNLPPTRSRLLRNHHWYRRASTGSWHLPISRLCR